MYMYYLWPEFMNLVVYRPHPAGWGLGTGSGLNLDINPLFAKFTKVKHTVAEKCNV